MLRKQKWFSEDPVIFCLEPQRDFGDFHSLHGCEYYLKLQD